MDENPKIESKINFLTTSILESLKKLFSDYITLFKEEVRKEIQAGVNLIVVIVTFVITAYTGFIALLFLLATYLLQKTTPLLLLGVWTAIYLIALVLLGIIARLCIIRIQTGISEPKELIGEFLKCLKPKKKEM